MTARATPGWHELAGTEALVAYLGERIGVSFEGARRPYLLAALVTEADRVGIRSGREYQELLERDAASFQHLVAELTVGETYFFREPRHLDLLRDVILPEVRSRRGPDHVVEVWSAACATGEEAYTVAMLLEGHGLHGRYRILATDLSRNAIEVAERAVYRPWSLRALTTQQRHAFFEPAADGVRVRPRFRERVIFRQHNLMESLPAVGGVRWAPDVVLCRNTLIYFTPAAVAQAADRLAGALAPGGWLLTGSADPPLPAHGLDAVSTPHGVAYRRPIAGGGAKARGVPLAQRPSPPREAAGRRTHPTNPYARRDRTIAPQPDPARVDDPTAAACRALQAADYARAIELAAAAIAQGGAGNATLHAVLVRALGNAGRGDAAIEAAAAAVARFPLDVELRYLHAVALLDTGRAAEAVAAAAAAAYLRPDLAVIHLTLGHAQRGAGDDDAARRSFRNARVLLEAMPADATVPLAAGESAERLAAVASVQQGGRSVTTRRSVGGPR